MEVSDDEPVRGPRRPLPGASQRRGAAFAVAVVRGGAGRLADGSRCDGSPVLPRLHRGDLDGPASPEPGRAARDSKRWSWPQGTDEKWPHCLSATRGTNFIWPHTTSTASCGCWASARPAVPTSSTLLG